MNKEMYYQMQILSQELQQVQQQLQNANQQLAELRKLDETLTDFSKVKPGTEALSALGNGIFAKSKIEDTKNVVMAVGANTSVTKPVEDAKKVVGEQTADMEKVAKELEKALSEGIARLQMMRQEMQAEAKK